MRKREFKFGLLFLLNLFYFPSHCAAIERISTVGAREAALASAVVALPGSFCVFHNQALLTENRVPSICASFRQPYFIRGLTESALSVIYPTSFSVLAIGITQTAIATYKESSFGISIAKRLSGKLSAGLLFNYFDLSFPEDGRHKGSFQVDGGLSYEYSRLLILGLHVGNIASTKIETFQNTLSFGTVIRGGASLKLTENILLTSEGAYEASTGISFRCGTEYLFNSAFRIRGGMSTKPFQHSFGFGYWWNFCQLDFAMVHHELLGYSPILSISFSLKQDGKHNF